MPHSYSELHREETCPYAGVLKKRKEQQTPMDLATVGQVFHEVAKEYAGHCVEMSVGQAPGEMRAIVDSEWNRARALHAKERKPFLPPSAKEEIQELADRFARNHVIDFENIIGLEEKMAVYPDGKPMGYERPEAWFRGIIDRLEDAGETVRIIDYKSGWAREADSLQMKIYAWLVSKHYPQYKAFEVTLDFVRFGVQNTKTYTREQVDAFEIDLRKRVAAIEADAFHAATPGKHCDACFFRGACDAKIVDINSIDSIEDAEKAVEAIGLLTARLSVQKDALRGWVSRNGPVEHNQTLWAHHPQGGMAIDSAESFFELMNEHSTGPGNPTDYMKVDNTKVRKKLLNPDGTPKIGYEFLSDLVVNKTSTAFRAKKAPKREAVEEVITEAEAANTA